MLKSRESSLSFVDEMEKLTKKQLRAVFKERRKSLDSEVEQALNAALLAQAQQFVWSGLDYLHLFLPIRKFREPDTFQLADWIREVYPEIQLVISKSDLQSNLLDHYLWEKDHILEVNRWGIEEPKGGEVINPQQLDAVIVPLLAFDKGGNRVGYGKGFYDRFLIACRPDCLIIGLSFFEAVEKIADVEPTDIPLDFCITPSTIWKFRKSH